MVMARQFILLKKKEEIILETKDNETSQFSESDEVKDSDNVESDLEILDDSAEDSISEVEDDNFTDNSENSDPDIDELDDFLDKPKFDPHGDPIPSKEGKIPLSDFKSLNELKVGEKGIIMGVKLDENSFLQYLNQKKIQIGV